MKKALIKIFLSTLVLVSTGGILEAQVLNLSVVNIGNNRIRIKGTPTAPGFTAGAAAVWTGMNLTWRIPKTAALPAPTGVQPAPTPEVTLETNNFTALTPRNVWDGNLDLTMFDLTSVGSTDDGYWYFQAVNTTDGIVQNLAVGDTVVLYEFTLPAAWTCPSCVEVVTDNTPGIPIGLGSFVSNGTTPDVLSLVQNYAFLPVNFMSFDAYKMQDEVQLAWRVTDEVNVYGYYVERSGDGRNWQTIGFAPFQPASTAINNYKLTDPHPLPGTNYYRIRQRDIDGRVAYSIIRTLRMNVNGLAVDLYPVPVKTTLNVKIQSSLNTQAYITITDALGRTVHHSSIRLRAGEQIEKLAVGEIKPGMYFVEIRGDGIIWSDKFIKE